MAKASMKIAPAPKQIRSATQGMTIQSSLALVLILTVFALLAHAWLTAHRATNQMVEQSPRASLRGR